MKDQDIVLATHLAMAKKDVLYGTDNATQSVIDKPLRIAVAKITRGGEVRDNVRSARIATFYATDNTTYDIIASAIDALLEEVR